MRGLGTIVNVATVVGGTAVGMALGARISERVRVTVLQGVGLVVLVIGVRDATATRNLVFPLVAIVLGGVLGELGRVEQRLEGLGARVRRLVQRGRAGGCSSGAGTFVDGFVTASLVFCIGPLTILGSIQDGLGRGSQDLVVKSVLDGTVAIVLASTLGLGVGLSALTVLVVQGGITLGAGVLDDVLTRRMVDELTATGGVIILGLGLRLLDLKPIRVGSFLPALVVAPVLVALFAR